MNEIRKLLKSRVAVLVTVTYTVVIAACGANIFSDKDDVNLGLQLDQEIRSNPREYPIFRDIPRSKRMSSALRRKSWHLRKSRSAMYIRTRSRSSPIIKPLMRSVHRAGTSMCILD